MIRDSLAKLEFGKFSSSHVANELFRREKVG
jgi:hypothetical protein